MSQFMELLPYQVQLRIYESLPIGDLISLCSVSKESFDLIIPNIYSKLVYLSIAKHIQRDSTESLNNLNKSILNRDNFLSFYSNLGSSKYSNFITELDISLLTKQERCNLGINDDELIEKIRLCKNLTNLELPNDLFLYQNQLNLCFNGSMIGYPSSTLMFNKINELSIDLNGMGNDGVDRFLDLVQSLNVEDISKLNVFFGGKFDYSNLNQFVILLDKLYSSGVYFNNLKELSVPILGGLELAYDVEAILKVMNFEKLQKLQISIIEPASNLVDSDDEDVCQEDILFNLLMKLGDLVKVNVNLTDLAIKYDIVGYTDEDFESNNNNLRFCELVKLLDHFQYVNLHLCLNFENIESFHLNLLAGTISDKLLDSCSIILPDLELLFPVIELPNEESIEEDDEEENVINLNSDLLINCNCGNCDHQLNKFHLKNLRGLNFNLNSIMLTELHSLQSDLVWLVNNKPGLKLWETKNYSKFSSSEFKESYVLDHLFAKSVHRLNAANVNFCGLNYRCNELINFNQFIKYDESLLSELQLILSSMNEGVVSEAEIYASDESGEESDFVNDEEFAIANYVYEGIDDSNDEDYLEDGEFFIDHEKIVAKYRRNSSFRKELEDKRMMV